MIIEFYRADGNISPFEMFRSTRTFSLLVTSEKGFGSDLRLAHSFLPNVS